MISKGWGNPNRMSITKIGTNTFIFNFSNDKEPKKIMEDAPWYILGHPLVLQWWVPQTIIQEVNFSYFPIWIQRHGISLKCFSINNVVKIEERISKVLLVENLFVGNNMLRGYLRVIRVLINIKEPLITGFWIPRNSLQKHGLKLGMKNSKITTTIVAILDTIKKRVRRNILCQPLI